MNKVIIIGRIANDVQKQTTASGIAYLRLTVAVDRDYKTQDGKEITDFVPVVVWRGNAEFLAKYASKGSRIAVEGSFTTNSFRNAQGQNVFSNEVSSERVQLLETKQESELRRTNTASNSSYQRPASNYNSTPNTNNNFQETTFSPAPNTNKSDDEFSLDDYDNIFND
ncbi:single-stranded DNA-binding protein [Mycoplasma procyoni]|uniref:single-stranded DNA-binding protein n=1 Tax=Mycoplasma procyoni TaxID=568784 RepID=UPI00197C9192|nr:single-stranded DNA-binding protein [Mycoplasma procyoni]MBN3534656.1 single-stranded DNA-binding protein [Mycoplasma procyoni]